MLKAVDSERVRGSISDLLTFNFRPSTFNLQREIAPSPTEAPPH